MTELTTRQQCEALQTELDDMSAKFQKHYDEVIKPALPEFFTKMIEEASAQMTKDSQKTKDDLKEKLDSPETLEAYKMAVETMKAMCAVHGVK